MTWLPLIPPSIITVTNYSSSLFSSKLTVYRWVDKCSGCLCFFFFYIISISYADDDIWFFVTVVLLLLLLKSEEVVLLVLIVLLNLHMLNACVRLFYVLECEKLTKQMSFKLWHLAVTHDHQSSQFLVCFSSEKHALMH